MQMSYTEKNAIKKELAKSLACEPEVVKIVVFGSFCTAADPHDIDVAVFQTSDQPYLPLALKYREKTRAIARRIALDIVPLKLGVKDGLILDSIAGGEVIYEK